MDNIENKYTEELKYPKYDFGDSQANKILSDNSIPLWYRILNVDAKHFEFSKYAGLTNNRARIKDLDILRKLAPGLYESCVNEVKEFNNYNTWDGKQVKKLPLGKKIGSIPILDWVYQPELQNDKKAQDKYFREHPEFKH